MLEALCSLSLLHRQLVGVESRVAGAMSFCHSREEDVVVIHL